MAKILPGSILAGASGRIGNLVTYNLKGTQVVRALPETSKKRKASPLQEQHIKSFKIQHAIAKSVKKTIIDKIWSHLPLTGGMNPYNQFIKRNRVAYGGSDHIAFPELMVISDGNLLPAFGFTAKKEGDVVKFTWSCNEPGKFASPSDKLNIMIMAFRSSLNMVDIEANRGDENAALSLAPGSAAVTEGFAFWSSENKESFSPSIYWICQ